LTLTVALTTGKHYRAACDLAIVRRFHAATLTFDMTLNASSTSDITWSNYVSNLTEIEHSTTTFLVTLGEHRRDIAAPDDRLLRFEMQAAQRRMVSKVETKFQTV